MSGIGREALDRMTALTVAANREAIGKSDFEARLISARATEASFRIAYRAANQRIQKRGEWSWEAWRTRLWP